MGPGPAAHSEKRSAISSKAREATGGFFSRRTRRGLSCVSESPSGGCVEEPLVTTHRLGWRGGGSQHQAHEDRTLLLPLPHAGVLRGRGWGRAGVQQEVMGSVLIVSGCQLGCP